MSDPTVREKSPHLPKWTGVVFFFLVGFGLTFAGLTDEDTLLVFSFAPMFLSALVGYGDMRLQTGIVAQFVLMGVWLGLQFEGPGPFQIPRVYFWALLATVAGFQTAKLATAWSNRIETYMRGKTSLPGSSVKESAQTEEPSFPPKPDQRTDN